MRNLQVCVFIANTPTYYPKSYFLHIFAVCGKELHSLTPLQLSGFRLHPGPLPEQYRQTMIVQVKQISLLLMLKILTLPKTF